MNNQFFCYSKELAKRNKSSLSIGKILLYAILGTIFFILLLSMQFATMLNSDSQSANPLFTLLLLSIILFPVFLGIKYAIDIRKQSTAFAIDDQGKIFRVTLLNTDNTGIIGISAGNFARTVSPAIGTATTALGAAAQIKSDYDTSQIMQNPEAIIKIIDTTYNRGVFMGAIVLEILNVYHYTETSKSIKITCDYRNGVSKKIYYRKQLKIYKVYQNWDQLMHAIITHRVI